MAAWTGPALYAYNDATFTARDYESLQMIACMGKVQDPTKTGELLSSLRDHAANALLFLRSVERIEWYDHRPGWDAPRLRFTSGFSAASLAGVRDARGAFLRRLRALGTNPVGEAEQYYCVAVEAAEALYALYPTPRTVEGVYLRLLVREFYKRAWSQPLFYAKPLVDGPRTLPAQWVTEVCIKIFQVVERVVALWGLRLVEADEILVDSLNSVRLTGFRRDVDFKMQPTPRQVCTWSSPQGIVREDSNVLSSTLLRRALKELWQGGNGPKADNLTLILCNAADVNRALIYVAADLSKARDDTLMDQFRGVHYTCDWSNT
eukprot:tig00000405_g468.t1